MFDLMTLSRDIPTPEGMIRLPSGLDVPDDGFSRLTQVYEEAYELNNDDVLVSIVGREPFKLPLTAFSSDRHVIAEDIVVLPGGVIETPQEFGLGTAKWCGGHVIDNRVTVRFNLDGHAATFSYDNPLAMRYADHTAATELPGA